MKACVSCAGACNVVGAVRYALCCIVRFHRAKQYNKLLQSVLCNAMCGAQCKAQRNTLPCSTVLHCTVQYCTAQHIAAQHHTVVCTVLCMTVMYRVLIVLYNAVPQHCARYGSVLHSRHGAVWCCTMPYCNPNRNYSTIKLSVLYSILYCFAVLYCIVVLCSAMCNTVQNETVQCCAVLHSTVQVLSLIHI